jgi:hypothetical protein
MGADGSRLGCSASSWHAEREERRREKVQVRPGAAAASTREEPGGRPARVRARTRLLAGPNGPRVS